MLQRCQPPRGVLSTGHPVSAQYMLAGITTQRAVPQYTPGRVPGGCNPEAFPQNFRLRITSPQEQTLSPREKLSMMVSQMEPAAKGSTEQHRNDPSATPVAMLG